MRKINGVLASKSLSAEDRDRLPMRERITAKRMDLVVNQFLAMENKVQKMDVRIEKLGEVSILLLSTCVLASAHIVGSFRFVPQYCLYEGLFSLPDLLVVG